MTPIFDPPFNAYDTPTAEDYRNLLQTIVSMSPDNTTLNLNDMLDTIRTKLIELNAIDATGNILVS